MATERIQIIVSDKGVPTVKKDIDSIGKSAGQSASGVDLLKGALTALISAQTIRAFYNLGDANIQLTNALKTTGLTGQALADQQNRLFDIAKQNGQDVNELTGIYQRLTSVQDQLGASAKDVNFTIEAIGASMRMSSSNAAAQAGALQQLQQLFGGVNVQAQEFNSLVDGAYPLLQAVAAGSERWGGSVAALTRDVKAGTVTSKEFFDALQKGGQANIDLAATFDLTLGQALTNFRTNIQQALISLQNMTGIFSGTANVVNFFANNLTLLAAIVSPLAAALTILGVQVLGGLIVQGFTAAFAATTTFYRALVSLNALILGNPIVAAITAVIAVMALVIESTVGWRKAFDMVVEGINWAIRALKSMLELMGATFSDGQWEIKITGDEAAEKIVEAGKRLAGVSKAGIEAGGNNAAAAMKAGIEAGGNTAAERLEQAQKAAIARYEDMNGKAVKQLGNTLTDGGDYIYNQVNGSLTKAGGEAAATMKDGVATGGGTAGQSMEKSIVSGGQKASAQIYSTIESAFASLAPLVDVFNAFNAQFRLQLQQQSADIQKTMQEARKLAAEADNAGRRFQSGTSGSTSFSSSGAVSSGGISGGANSYNPIWPFTGTSANETQETTNETITNQQSGDTNVGITNVLGRDLIPDAINSNTGKNSIINVIKLNREEFQAALGIM